MQIILALYLNTVIGQLIPYTAIAVLNALIIRGLIKQRNKRAQMMRSAQGNQGAKTYGGKSKTAMLVIASTFSLVITIPDVIGEFFTFTGYRNTSLNAILFVYWAAYIISPWKYCGSFFFYILSGERFRRQLFQILTFGKLGRPGEELF